MFRKFNYKNITWIDVDSPTPEESKQIGAEYNIHPLVVEELTIPSQRSKADVYKDFIYLVLHFPFCRLCAGPDGSVGAGETNAVTRDSQEVDFVIGRDFIITAHYEPISALRDFSKIFEGGGPVKKEETEIHAGFLFYYMMKEIYSSLETDLNVINDRLKSIERKVFSGQEMAVVKALADINRELLDFRWAMKNHHEILASLEVEGDDLFGAKFRYHLRAISGENDRIWKMIESNRSTFLDLRETNESLLSIKSNQTMKLLAVLAFIFLPLTILSQIFSMNTSETPIIGNPGDFYVILGLMAFIVSFLYVVAKVRRWL